MKINQKLGALLLIGALTALNAAYILDQRAYDIVIQFGDIVREDKEPGLKFKIPFIESVKFFDNRIQTIIFAVDDTAEVVSADQKTMRLSAFAKYYITNPVNFFKTVKDEYTLRSRMASLMESAIREVVGSVKFTSVLGKDRINVMNRITEMVKVQMKKFGVEIIDVRISRIALPEKARDAVYGRMKTEREKEAREIRATGAEKGQIIRADANRERTVMVAEAAKNAEAMRGEAESEALKSLTTAVGNDVEFFSFFESMEAYKNAFKSKDTKLVLSNGTPFLKYMSE